MSVECSFQLKNGRPSPKVVLFSKEIASFGEKERAELDETFRKFDADHAAILEKHGERPGAFLSLYGMYYDGDGPDGIEMI